MKTVHPSPMPTADEFEAVLGSHVIDVWFPRSLDREYGGFLFDFNYRWDAIGPNEKLLESQARHTWFASEAARFWPGDHRLREAMEHGFSYLSDALWDRTEGGWFHRVDRAGLPIEEDTKHTQGFAYAILACVSVYEATGSQTALDLAREGFDWIFRNAYDRQHGGFFGYLRRDGMVIRSPDTYGHRIDTIGAPVGCKDMAVHSALLEAFTQLDRCSGEARVRGQLAEMVDVICKRMTTPLGAHHQYCLADWTPTPHLARFGHEFYNAVRLLKFARLLEDKEHVVGAARRFVDHAIRYGLDRRRGGFYYAGPSIEPIALRGQALMVRQKQWWVQMGALQALLAMHEVAPEEPGYLQQFQEQWRYIQRHFLDALRGGTYTESSENLPRWRRKSPRLAPAYVTRKGSVWKDSSHDGRALLYCISAVRKME